MPARPCPRCQGSGTCKDCGGSGSVLCLSCEGKGSRTTPRGLSYSCKACGGQGRVTCPTECASCAGSGQITEQLQQEVHAKYRPKYDDTSPLTAVSSVLFALNVVIFLIGLMQPFGHRLYLLFGNFGYTAFTEHQYWRFITPMFLHGGIVHLLFNCSFLMRYCPPLEGMYGSRRFLALYLVSGLLGNVLSWLCQPMHVAGIGASGALFGVGTAFLVIHYRYGYFNREEIRSWSAYLFGYLALGFAADFLNINIVHVDNWGHLGGALGGVMVALLLGRPRGH